MGESRKCAMRDAEGRLHLIWRFLPLAGAVIWGSLCITNNLWYDEAYSMPATPVTSVMRTKTYMS